MRYQRALILVVIGWYLILILGHYFNQRPLWNDEQCVLNNIIQLKPAALFSRPLLSDQAFPRLYLWAIQQFSKSFNDSILALRLFPLLAMMGAFFVWLKIARRTLGQSWDLILLIGCWCASVSLVYYAAELKPYSMDVLVAGLIVLFMSDLHGPPLILLFLPLLGLLSYPALFLLLLPLYNLVRDSFEERRWLPELSFYLAGYILTLGLVYIFDFRVSAPHLIEDFWHEYFISLDSWKAFFNTLGKGMNSLIGRQFAESPRWIKIPSRIFIGFGLVYMLAVFWGQFKKDHFILRSIVPLAFAMFLVQLVLAFLRMYPLAVPRMSLFFSPLLLLVTVLAVRFVHQRQNALGIFLRIIFAGYLLFVSLGIAWDVLIKRDLGAESAIYSRFVAL